MKSCGGVKYSKVPYCAIYSVGLGEKRITYSKWDLHFVNKGNCCCKTADERPDLEKGLQ